MQKFAKQLEGGTSYLLSQQSTVISASLSSLQLMLPRILLRLCRLDPSLSLGHPGRNRHQCWRARSSSCLSVPAFFNVPEAFCVSPLNLWHAQRSTCTKTIDMHSIRHTHVSLQQGKDLNDENSLSIEWGKGSFHRSLRSHTQSTRF